MHLQSNKINSIMYASHGLLYEDFPGYFIVGTISKSHELDLQIIVAYTKKKTNCAILRKPQKFQNIFGVFIIPFASIIISISSRTKRYPSYGRSPAVLMNHLLYVSHGSLVSLITALFLILEKKNFFCKTFMVIE